MTMQEADKLYELVWAVDTSYLSHQIWTELYMTEEEARAAYDKASHASYRNIYQTYDIWGWKKRQAQ